MIIDSPSITDAPLDDERVRNCAPSLLLALIWLYGLEIRAPNEKRTDDYKMEKMLAMRATELAIADATGLQPEGGTA